MSFNLFLPSVYGNPALVVEPAANEKVVIFAFSWWLALGDRAKAMHRDDRLMAVAGAHAEFLSRRTGETLAQSMHIGLGGSTPNERVRAGGYRLPDHYRQVGNSVESCASNWQGPTYALDRLIASPSHRAHMLGEGGFASHTVYGIGNAKDYWVVITCPPE